MPIFRMPKMSGNIFVHNKRVLPLGFLKFLKRDKSKELDMGLEEMEDLDMPPMPPDFEEKNLAGMGKEFEELPELPELPKGEEDFSDMEKGLPELELPEKQSPLSMPKASAPEFPEPAGKEGFPRYLGPTVPKPAGKETFPRYSEPTVPKPAGKQSFPRYLGPTVPKPKESKEPISFPKPMFGMWQKPLFGSKPEEQRPRVGLSAGAAEFPEPMPEIKPYERLERAAVREERAILKHKEAESPIYVRADRFRDIITNTGTIRNNLKLASQSIIKLNEVDAKRDRALERWKNVMIDLQKKLIFIDKTLFDKR